MKNIISILVIILAIIGRLDAQNVKPEASTQFMPVNMVESVVAGGLGRSKMIITNPDGSQKETGLENLSVWQASTSRTSKKMKTK